MFASAVLAFALLPPCPEPPRPVLPADLHAARTLYWSGESYPLILDARGTYHCGEEHGRFPAVSGHRYFWAGTWAISEPGTITLSEGHYRVLPDRQPEELTAPRPVVLKIRWEDGRLVGTGWGSAVRLEP